MNREILITEAIVSELNIGFSMGKDLSGNPIRTNQHYNGEVTISFTSSGDFGGYSELDLKIIIANAVFEKLQNLTL